MNIIPDYGHRVYYCEGCERQFEHPLTAFKPYRLEHNLCPRCLRELKRALRQREAFETLVEGEDELISIAGGFLRRGR